MDQSERAHIFWKEIPGPRRILSDITGALMDARPVILDASEVPWMKDLRYMACSELQKEGIYAEELNAREDRAGKAGNPGLFLLERFGRKEDINRYREGIDPPLHEYLRSHHVLDDKLVCVWGISQERSKGWLDFVKRYKAKTPHDGLFLLETEKADLSNAASSAVNKLAVIDVRSMISVYDVLSFAMLLASPLSFHVTWKHYLSWLASTVFENDIESLALFFAEESPRLDSPERLLTVLENHVEDPKQLRTAAWRAQLQIIFPLIENLRVYLIERHREKIQIALDRTDILYCGKKVEDPYDAELGFLIFLANQRISSNSGERLLFFPQEEFSNMVFLHECRNSIAHRDPCDAQKIEMIIRLAEANGCG